MKCETPAFASVSSREPAPIQKPRATERTLGTRSEITRSPVSSSETTYFWTCTGALSWPAAVAAYRFLTTWLFDAPREPVWDVIYDAAHWPEWWRGVVRTAVVDERLWRSAWRSVLPYTLEFEFEILRAERPTLLEGRARGELAGGGVWRVYEGEPGARAPRGGSAAGCSRRVSHGAMRAALRSRPRERDRVTDLKPVPAFREPVER